MSLTVVFPQVYPDLARVAYLIDVGRGDRHGRLLRAHRFAQRAVPMWHRPAQSNPRETLLAATIRVAIRGPRWWERFSHGGWLRPRFLPADTASAEVERLLATRQPAVRAAYALLTIAHLEAEAGRRVLQLA